MRHLSYFTLIWDIVITSSCSSHVEVTLPGIGGLTGAAGRARNGDLYYQFLGIPFAEPPTGDRRLRPPVRASPWKGTRDASKFGAHCLQMPLRTPTEVTGSEDCLYINVFTKTLDVTARKPVLVFIHGGAFIAGGTSSLTAEYLLEEDVVLVTLQYRLGPLGWLTTADSKAPGNLGLLDQILALRWVQDHITQFGGDKELVTISGMSAGGARVHYLLLSPQTDGLFHRAITMSGSALCWWANIPHQDRTTARLASDLNCPTSSSAEMVDCLRRVSGREMMVAQAALYPWHPDGVEKAPKNIWSPRPDPEAGLEAVLAVEPLLALKAGHIQPVPLLVGTAESEGVWPAGLYLTRPAVMEEFTQHFDQISLLSLGLQDQVTDDRKSEVIRKIKDFYLGSEEGLVTGMVNMFGDAFYSFAIDTTLKLQQAGQADSPVWVYQYNFRHNHSIAFLHPASRQIEELSRASHSHEMPMIFPTLLKELGPLSEEETTQSRKFIKLLMDFILNGTPSDQKDWKPLSDGEPSYFVVDESPACLPGLPHQQRMNWWNSLPVFWNKNNSDKSEL